MSWIAANTDDKLRSSEMRGLCSCGWLLTAIKTLCLVLFFYTFSIGLTFYNKKYIMAFQFPLSITMLHLCVKFLIALAIRSILYCKTGRDRVELGWRVYASKIAPTGISSSIDIGLSNWSFEYITVSLYTMTKSTCILFIMGFSILFGLEKKRWSLVLVVLCIALGLFMFTYQSTQFNLVGFLLVLTASFISGIRWTLAQLVVQKSEIGLSHPLDMIYHVQPWMIVGLLPLAIYFESKFVVTTDELFNTEDMQLVFINTVTLLLGAILAFMLEFSEFLLVSHTSGLTLSIAGIFKEICTLFLAATVNGDKMNPVNFIGLFVCLFGISLHVLFKLLHGPKSMHRHR
ncbi:solute carrier family 35 member C2-like isoform X2 [Tubulanus polymorphus]|uniref:solute carrier family 35 member C2-like isoform X2 n=1 Tax=Tubulanus polymorphus TaxID=672921 RepID=UPI003DA3F71B